MVELAQLSRSNLVMNVLAANYLGGLGPRSLSQACPIVSVHASQVGSNSTGFSQKMGNC